MEHTEQHSCCYGHNEHAEHKCHGCCHEKIELTNEEKEFLLMLAKTPFLPIVSFVAKSSKSTDLENIMLSPVYIENSDDSLEIIKERANILNNLEEKGAISVDCDIKINNANYDIYKDSKAYSYFSEMISESKNNSAFIFDIPCMELGSIALSGIGQILIDGE